MYIAFFILLSFGISIGGLLWEGEVIPPWLISIFLLPAALVLDYFTKGKFSASKIRKYSTTIGVLCVTLTGYLFIDFLGLGTVFAFALLGFLALLVFFQKYSSLNFFSVLDSQSEQVFHILTDCILSPSLCLHDKTSSIPASYHCYRRNSHST